MNKFICLLILHIFIFQLLAFANEEEITNQTNTLKEQAIEIIKNKLQENDKMHDLNNLGIEAKASGNCITVGVTIYDIIDGRKFSSPGSTQVFVFNRQLEIVLTDLRATSYSDEALDIFEKECL